MPKKIFPIINTLVFFKRSLLIIGIAFGGIVASAYPAYLIGRHFFNRYFNGQGTRLVELEKRGLLSKKFGAAWQDVIKDEAMEHQARSVLGTDTAGRKDTALVVDGIFINDYPSLSIIARLNAVQNYSNEIRIVDRRDRDIARIRTNHTRAKIKEFPSTLLAALVAAEDGNFWNNPVGAEYGSIVRAFISGAVHCAATFSLHAPKGTSTITQQVAKLFISDTDTAGHRHVKKTFDRKVREMRLANALRKAYPAQDILEVYVNHCITSDNGLIGCKDIARALFDRDLGALSDAQCIYLARMVKWGRNVKSKIVKQCVVDMPRMAKALGWDARKQREVIDEIRNLTFNKPKQIQTDFGPLVDCANEYWHAVLAKNGASDEQCSQMNIVNPSSLVRKKGNLLIRLSIDLPLQRELERLVNARGYGPDSTAMIGGRPILVSGQYYAYGIMDSKTGRLLAYYSKDRIGSRLSALLRNRTPNGSSTAKPIFNALMFDLGIFFPYARWTDSVEVRNDVAWQRVFKIEKGRPTGVIFTHSSVKGRGYEVHNHGDVLEGCQYVFDQLNASNNILGVETVYRLNRRLFAGDGGVVPEAFSLVQYFYRIAALARLKDTLGLRSVTGVRVYKELARIAGAMVDSVESGKRRVPVSDSLYSVGLGTLELSLYEQLHLFNVLYANDLIERPADHPSLFIDNIVLNGDTVAMNDTIKRFHPFADLSNVRPTYLGLHKRLVTTDGLDAYDIPAPPDSAGLEQKESFDGSALPLLGPASNIAKSGTTDDVIKPFNATLKSGRKTNYGLWNAIIRIDLSKLGQDGQEPDVRDITVSCIGECNEKYTGPRDGKTLHKFLTKNLLSKAGIQCPSGFYTRYEAYLKRVTPKDSMECGAVSSAAQQKTGTIFEKIISIFRKKGESETGIPKIDTGGPVTKGQD